MSFREDFIKRLISQFVHALHNLLGVIKKQDYEGAMEMVSQIRLELLGLSSHLANSLSPSDLIQMLSPGDEPNPAKPLILAELFKVEGDIYSAQGQENLSFKSYLTSLELLLEISQEIDETQIPEEFTGVEAIAELLDEYVLPSDTLVALFHFYESAGRYALAEEALFDYIEDSPNPQEGLAAGLTFIERLREKTADELSAGELTLAEVNEMEARLIEIQDTFNNK
ncbi:MAG: DUF6483 family protein [Chloroflexota bacterium]